MHIYGTIIYCYSYYHYYMSVLKNKNVFPEDKEFCHQMNMQVPRQDYTICALDLGKEQPSHAFELIFPEGFHVTSLFTEQVLNTFKLLPIAMDESCISKSIYFRKNVDPAAHHHHYDSANAVFEVTLDTEYHTCYPRWNRWVVWRAPQEHALNGLIQLIVHEFSHFDDNSIIRMMIAPNSNFTLTQLCEEIKNRYPLPYLEFITCRNGNTIVMEFVGEFNAFKWLERHRIHSLGGTGVTKLEDLNDPRISCTCQYDCPGFTTTVPVQIRVEPATLTREWSFQHENASVLYEPILNLANGYCLWLWKEDPVWRTMVCRLL